MVISPYDACCSLISLSRAKMIVLTCSHELIAYVCVEKLLNLNMSVTC